MKKALALLAIVALGSTAFGNAGWFDSFIIVNTGSDTWYDLGASTGNTDFQGANLGSFDSGSDTLTLGGQIKAWDDAPDDIYDGGLNYRIWQGTEGGSFTQVDYNWISEDGNNETWGSDGTYSSDIISSLANGTYTLEVFAQVDTQNGSVGTMYDNGTGNYEATFTVVPEPATIGMLGLGGLLTLLVRRTRAH